MEDTEEQGISSRRSSIQDDRTDRTPSISPTNPPSPIMPIIGWVCLRVDYAIGWISRILQGNRSVVDALCPVVYAYS